MDNWLKKRASLSKVMFNVTDKEQKHSLKSLMASFCSYYHTAAKWFNNNRINHHYIHFSMIKSAE